MKLFFKEDGDDDEKSSIFFSNFPPHKTKEKKKKKKKKKKDGDDALVRVESGDGRNGFHRDEERESTIVDTKLDRKRRRPRFEEKKGENNQKHIVVVKIVGRKAVRQRTSRARTRLGDSESETQNARVAKRMHGDEERRRIVGVSLLRR